MAACGHTSGISIFTRFALLIDSVYVAHHNSTSTVIMFKRSLFNSKISKPCLALNFYLVLNTVIIKAFELAAKSENVLESKIALKSKSTQKSETDLKSVEIIEQISDEIEQSQIDTFEWRQAYRRRWTKSPSSGNSREQLEQEQDDDNLLNSLSVQKQQFSFRKIPVESPISLLLELNNAVSSETRFGDDFRDVMISGEYTERGSFDENLLKLTVQQILMLQNYGCWCPKLVKDKKSDAFCGETVDKKFTNFLTTDKFDKIILL